VDKRLPRYTEIFEAIWKKAKETNPSIGRMAIYKRVEAVRRKFKNTISSKMAANILAAEIGLDVYRLLTDKEELKELRNLLRTTPPQVIVETKKVSKKDEEKLVSVSRKIAETLGLPRNLAREAERMADVYPTLYVFENLVRHTVKTVLEKEYGDNWWNLPSVVSSKVKNKVERRKLKEGKNRWHSRRGSHEIFYTDFGDLNAIISINHDKFNEVFEDLEIELNETT